MIKRFDCKSNQNICVSTNSFKPNLKGIEGRNVESIFNNKEFL